MHIQWIPTGAIFLRWILIIRHNMDFLNKDIRDYFFRQYPDIYSKVEDLPPAKYNVGSNVKNSLVSSGCIINGTVENSILFKGFI